MRPTPGGPSRHLRLVVHSAVLCVRLTCLDWHAGIGIQVTDGSQVLIQGNVIEGEAGPGIVASAINGLDIRSNVTTLDHSFFPDECLDRLLLPLSILRSRVS